MKLFIGLTMAIFFVLTGTESFAQDYAIVTTKMNPNKKYYATEFGYGKLNNSVIIYYERPESGRIFQDKDKIKISSKIGNIKFDSDKSIWINKDNPPKSINIIYTEKNYIAIDGNFVIKDKTNKVIANGKMDYTFLDFNNNNDKFTVCSLTKKDLILSQKNVKIMTIDGASIHVEGNKITLKKSKFSLTFRFDTEMKQAYCFVH